jgi:ribosomal protein S18 acetylase RimI-like enzyme
MIEFRYLQPEYARAAADIHIEGQQGTILTQLGYSFLEEFYRAVCVSQWAEGIGAFDDDRLIAHAAIAVSSAKFFGEFKIRHLWRVALPVSWSVLRHPQIMAHIVKGWSYADQAGSPEREADVLFLGVKRDYRRNGVAPELVRYMFGWGGSINLKTATFMVEKRNRPMRWMIGQLNGLYIDREFEAYGRQMLFYKVPIAPNLADARFPLGQPYTPAYIYSQNGTEG